MKSKAMTLGGVAIAALSIAACSSVSEATGVRKKTPDEFNVVTKAPLVVPPEFGLRPPRTGAELPVELAPGLRGRNILFGQDLGKDASAGEKALVTKAGAISTDVAIRTRVDYEDANIIRKSGGLVQQVFDFVPLTNTTTKADGTPLNPEEETVRLQQIESVKSATGGGKVVIERGKPGVKLPGT